MECPQFALYIVWDRLSLDCEDVHACRGIIPPLGGTLDLSPILAFVALDVSLWSCSISIHPHHSPRPNICKYGCTITLAQNYVFSAVVQHIVPESKSGFQKFILIEKFAVLGPHFCQKGLCKILGWLKKNLESTSRMFRPMFWAIKHCKP